MGRPLRYAADMATTNSIACIILDEEPLGQYADNMPPILIAGRSVLARQIAMLFAAGFTEIVLLGRVSVGAWGDHVTGATSVAQLLDRVSDDQSIMILGAASLPSPELLDQMRATQGGAILVRDAATSDDRHERIDLNDRFAGLLLMSKTVLSHLPDVDEDWSLLSMMLRHAVQLDMPRVPIPIGPMEPIRCDDVRSTDDAEKWQLRALDAHIAGQSALASPLQRWLVLPIVKLALPSLWNGGRELLRYIPYAAFALGVLALIFAWLAWPVAAILVLITAKICDEVAAQSSRFNMEAMQDSEIRWAFGILCFIMPLWIVIWSNSMPSLLAAIASGTLVSLALLHQQIARPVPFWVGPVETMALALCAILAGVGIGTAALLIAAVVMVQNVWRPLALRLKTI